tara:strand:- start:257 stop:748 length:492 start_codon:yes stop_codon:yes gene_type:complete
MHPSELKKKLTKRHKDWINIVKSFGLKDYAEDLVQEMYIRVIKYIDDGKDISYKGDINYIYVYQCLRHMTLNLQIKKAKINVINIDDYLYKLKKSNNLDQDIEKTYKRINKKLDDMFWYDAKVYRIIEGGMSIKELSRQSKISYYSLYRTYNKVKNILKDEIR